MERMSISCDYLTTEDEGCGFLNLGLDWLDTRSSELYTFFTIINLIQASENVNSHLDYMDAAAACPHE